MRGLSLLSVNPLSRTSLPGGGVTLGALALAFWVIGLTMASIGHIHNLGLITVLGWPYFVALALLSLGVVLELQRDELAPRRLIALIVAFVVVLFGTSSALVPVATITDSYIHMGFVGYIAHHGHVLNNYDARFSWPGAFALAASVLAFTGQSSALVFLRWFPVVIELAYLAPLLVIARKSGVSKRASYLGIVFFYVGNWIYQDYFSPQALNFFFFLVVVATVLSLWSPLTSASSERSLAARWNATLRSLRPVRWGGHETVASFGAARTLILSAAVMIIVWASSPRSPRDGRRSSGIDLGLDQSRRLGLLGRLSVANLWLLWPRLGIAQRQRRQSCRRFQQPPLHRGDPYRQHRRSLRPRGRGCAAPLH